MSKKLGAALVMLVVLFISTLFWRDYFYKKSSYDTSDILLKGKYSQNSRLQSVERLGEEKAGFGPEDVAIDSEGRIYTGMKGGRIVRLDINGKNPELFANTKGRPLGLAFDKNENLIVADMEKGLLSVAKNASITTLANEADNKSIMFANDLDIASDGTIYFSDSSIYNDPNLDKMYGRPTGRLIAYYPDTQTTKVLLKNLYFANGVALSSDESFVLICETGAYRITRYWLKGLKQGKSDTFIEDLPGLPDNISFNGKDIFWVALLLLRNLNDEIVTSYSFVDKIVIRLRRILNIYPESIRYGFILGIDQSGEVIYNLQDPTGKYTFDVTSVKEYDNMLYLGTISDSFIKRLPTPQLSQPMNRKL